MSRTVSDLLAHPVSCIWSSITGSICYFLSPTFKNHLKEKSLRVVVYTLLCLSVPISMLLARKWGSMKHPYLRITVYCIVLVGTSLYSFFENNTEQGRKENGYGSFFDLFSYGAFSLAALSISRKIDFGFEVGMFSFFLQALIATALNMNNIFITVGTVAFCCFLIHIRFYLEYNQSHIGTDSHPLREIHVERDLAFNSVHSNSNRPHRVIHDVFVSFVYEDTLCVFTDHLLASLLRKKVKTHRDFSAIQSCRICLIIFSKEYASSHSRLDELEKIMECRSKYGKTVVPIYHDIDPSVVECQSGIYKDAFARHELEFDNLKVQSWRNAMSEAAQLVGWHARSILQHRSEPVDEIIQDVLQNLNPTPQAECVYTDEAYISFCAEGPTKMFASELYHALSRKRIRASKDEQFRKGGIISECRGRALETSNISLIIFSEGYAKSERCLEEVLKAMECHRRKAQIVLPIFFDVSPSEVKRQRGKFEVGFNKNGEKVEMWRRALSEAADIPGYNLSFVMEFYDRAEEIAEDVFRKLNPIHNQVDEISMDEMVMDEEFNQISDEETLSNDGDFDPTSNKVTLA